MEQRLALFGDGWLRMVVQSSGTKEGTEDFIHAPKFIAWT